MDKDTRVVTLLSARSDDGQPINFIDDLDIAPNGKIYFSDASNIPPHKARDGSVDLQ